MRTPGSALGCSWGRVIRLTHMLTRPHMLTRTRAIITIPTIIRTHTATIRPMDIGAADIIGGTVVDTADNAGVAAVTVSFGESAAVAVPVGPAAVVAVTDGAGKQSARVVD